MFTAIYFRERIRFRATDAIRVSQTLLINLRRSGAQTNRRQPAQHGDACLRMCPPSRSQTSTVVHCSSILWSHPPTIATLALPLCGLLSLSNAWRVIHLQIAIVAIYYDQLDLRSTVSAILYTRHTEHLTQMLRFDLILV